ANTVASSSLAGSSEGVAEETADGFPATALAAGVSDGAGVADGAGVVELIHPARVAAPTTSAAIVQRWLAPPNDREDLDTSVTSV
ncbi:MAG: hypothetical protein ACHQ02_09400, partial [Candidatus Limnocylindrales bacterium]